MMLLCAHFHVATKSEPCTLKPLHTPAVTPTFAFLTHPYSSEGHPPGCGVSFLNVCCMLCVNSSLRMFASVFTEKHSQCSGLAPQAGSQLQVDSKLWSQDPDAFSPRRTRRKPWSSSTRTCSALSWRLSTTMTSFIAVGLSWSLAQLNGNVSHDLQAELEGRMWGCVDIEGIA